MSSEIVQVRQSPFCDYHGFPTLLALSFCQLVLALHVWTPLRGGSLHLWATTAP